MYCWTLHLNRRGPEFYRQAAVTVGDKVYSFGGFRNADKDPIDANDVHVFNTASLRWRKLTPVTRERHLHFPSRRWGHTAVLIEYTVYIWGGCNYNTGEYYNVLYAFDVDTHGWFKPEVSGTVPEARVNHSACVLGKVMYVHGGHTSIYECYNDTYKLDTATQVWTLIKTRGTPPPASSSHYSATVIGTKMFVFVADAYNNNFVRVFDTETDLWLNTPYAQLLAEERWDQSAFTYNGELYIFGGRTLHNPTLNDLWKFSPETFSWKKVEPKGKGLCGYKMCCCVVGDRIVFFGGESAPADLYVLDFSPSLKTLCKLSVIQYGLEQSELSHNIRKDLEAMCYARPVLRGRRRQRH